MKVCPTGIDIRNGTQLECINCTNCIDACDAIMEKFNFDQGLIRYASETTIKEKKKLTLTPRIIGYSIVLTLLMGVLAFMLITRNEVQATIMRVQGQLYQDKGAEISTIYNIKLINKTIKDIPVELRVVGDISGRVELVEDKILVKKEGLGDAVFFIYIDKNKLKSRKNKIEVGVFEKSELITKVKTTFLAPNI